MRVITRSSKSVEAVIKQFASQELQGEKEKMASVERECNAGISPRIAGYQAGTRGGNGGAETKLPSGARKRRKSVGNEFEIVRNRNIALEDPGTTPSSKKAHGKKKRK